MPVHTFSKLMAQRTIPLTPPDSASLTRLILSYCLGKGSLTPTGRTYSLQVAHPKRELDYSTYQYQRIKAFLPTMKEPYLYAVHDKNGIQTGIQWRVRVSSKNFETAYNLLYGSGRYQINSPVLELLGAEAIASLWADRGRVLLTKNGNFCAGRLNLPRCSHDEAQLLHDWIWSLTGAVARVHHSPLSQYTPMLYYENNDVITLMDALRHTWMARATCLEKKFRTPRNDLKRPTRASERERIAASMLMPQVLHRKAPQSIMVRRSGGRRVPGLPPERPIPNGVPILRTLPEDASTLAPAQPKTKGRTAKAGWPSPDPPQNE
jgi:hypothetical protein